MDVYTDEIFGPVLTVLRVPTLDEAHRADQRQPLRQRHRDLHLVAARRRARSSARSRSGMIGINVPIPVPMAYHSFGGWKDSLFGDHHIHGPEGVRFYTRAKVVTTRWPHVRRGVPRPAQLPDGALSPTGAAPSHPRRPYEERNTMPSRRALLGGLAAGALRARRLQHVRQRRRATSGDGGGDSADDSRRPPHRRHHPRRARRLVLGRGQVRRRAGGRRPTASTCDYSSDPDPGEQSTLIDSAVADGTDGLVISMANPDGLEASIKAAVAAGVPVITINSGIDDWRGVRRDHPRRPERDHRG